MLRQASWIVAAFVFWAGPVNGGDKDKVAWNFAKGDRFFIERTVKQKQTIHAQKKIFKQESSNRWLSAVVVSAKTPEGGYVLALEIEAVVRTLFDAATNKSIPDKLTEKMTGAQFTIDLSKAGKITKFAGYDAFIKQLMVGQKAELEKALRTLMPEDILRDSLEEVFGWIPAGPVAKGDSWNHVTKEAMGPFGHFLSTYDLTYDGAKDGRQVVTAQIKSQFKAPTIAVDLFKVTRGDFKAEEGKASYFLGSDGKTLESTKQIVLKGTIEVEAAGTPGSFDLVSENSLTMRVFTKDDQKAPKGK